MKIQAAPKAPDRILLVRSFSSGKVPDNQPFFKAERNEIWWPHENEMWLGLGKSPQPPQILKSFRLTFFKKRERWPKELALDINGFNAGEAEAALIGVLLAGYNLQLYKTDPKVFSAFFNNNGSLTILSKLPADVIEKVIFRAQTIADTQMRAMDLMNAPANKKPPRALADWALASAKKFGYDTTVFDRAALEALGAAALLSVNKGSAEPPVLIVADYSPAKPKKTVAIVGKGITFDTGGTSLKASASMHLMKSDMCGGGAALGIVELAARLQIPVRVIAVVPSTENAIDGDSTKPGDVINSLAGKTIEVIDTDAEGRLILADALYYAVTRFKPDVMIDLATLTGSIIQTLGYAAAGLFTSANELAEQLISAGENTGEKLWLMPLWEEYKDEIASDIADVRNYHGKPIAGAIVAAKFLQVFTNKHPAWAHLDIAGTAYGDTEFAPNRASTAFGIRLLENYLQSLS